MSSSAEIIPPIKTLKHLAYILKIRLQELIAFAKEDNIRRNYLEHVFPKLDKQTGQPLCDKFGRPRVRVINPSINRLKVIQGRILTNILNKIPVPEYAYGGVKNKDNVMNSKVHLGHKYKFVTDLRNFFPSVTNKMVYDMFVSRGYSADVSRCLARLTTHKGHVPQGVSCSSMITNLVFEKTGNMLCKFAKENNITFTSFVDDLTFSSTKDFKYLIPQIIDILYAGGYILSHNKTAYKAGNLPITGVFCEQHKLLPLKPFLEKIENIGHYSEAQAQGLLMYQKKIEEANKRKRMRKTKYTEI